ncbi:MAG: hypothetical protein WCT99_04170 [Bacteroidota bacterium]
MRSELIHHRPRIHSSTTVFHHVPVQPTADHQREQKRKNSTMTTTIIQSNDSGRCIEMIHHPDDPANWIVRSSKKVLWFRTKSVTMHFLSKVQALAYAQNSTK